MNEFVKTPLPKRLLLAPSDIPADFAEAGARWLVEQAMQFFSEAELSEQKPGIALIHADDGVLWGRLEKGRLVTASYKDWVPVLRTPTIQQCRLFGKRGELFIWREAEGVWRGRLVIDEDAAYVTLKEKHILWGNLAGAPVNGFTPIYERDSGQRQVVPLLVSAKGFGAASGNSADEQRVVLTICHYLSEDEDGQMFVYCSRLQSLAVSRIAE